LAEIYGGISYKTLFFIIIIPKIGLIFLLLNFINNVFYEIFPLLHNVFLILGLICIYVGSFCGLAQRALKKLLAFSSIVNLGYILILFSTLSGFNLIFSIVYLISYFINLIILFILVILLNKFIGDKDFKITEINQLSNLFKTHPIFAITLAISIFSVAGLPPFGGFYSKYFIIVDLINNGLISVCLAILLLGSISTFYYIRIIKIIFFNNDLADKSDFYNKNQNSIITLNLQDDYIATYFLSFLVFCFLSINFIIILYPSLLFYPLFFLLLI
jgi:NADH-quinone oxidoreductase subunit N